MKWPGALSVKKCGLDPGKVREVWFRARKGERQIRVKKRSAGREDPGS